MSNQDSGSETSPIPLTGTGPFAPPNDLTLEEYLRWLRIGTDLQTVTAGVLMSPGTPVKKEKPQDLGDLTLLQDQTDSALNRLSKDNEFLIGLAQKLGEAGFEDALTRANLKDEQMLATLRQKAQEAGGFVPMVEKLLSNMPSEFSAQRARMRASFDSLRKSGEAGVPKGTVLVNDDANSLSPSTVKCILGAGMVVHGSLAVVGGALITGTLVGAVAGGAVVALGSFEVGFGAAAVTQDCF